MTEHEPDSGRMNVAPGQPHDTLLSETAAYVIGLALALVLTGVSFWVASTSVLWGPGVAVGLVVLAIAQMGVHLVFFLHITSGPDNTNNVLALAFGVTAPPIPFVRNYFKNERLYAALADFLSAVIARVPCTISLIRRGGTEMSWAKRYWDSPSGSRKSAKRTSPG